MDYVVKNLYEKNEEELLDVLDDLNLIIQADSSSSSGTMNSYQISSDNVHSGSTNSSVPHQFASIEIFQEYNALNKNFQSLTKELERNLQNHQNPDNQREDPLAMALEINNNSDRSNKSASSNQPTPFLSPSKTLFASPTAKQIFNEYLTNLENYIFNYREKINILMKKKLLLMKKIQQLIEYFGEEKTNYLVKVTENNNNNSNSQSSTAGGLKSGILSNNNNNGSAAAIQSLYDVSSIFLALKNFCRSRGVSKEQYEWKISRNQK
jgi:hypothetical protein